MNSHIIPEFMYKHFYPPAPAPRGFYKVIRNPDKAEGSKNKILQKGIREYLLCGDCEGLLSKYENYAAEEIYAKNSRNKSYILKSIQTPDLQYFQYDLVGLSYTDFKLFLLSILWRVIISKSKGFETPYIENSITERLRVNIHSQNPLDFDDFGCSLELILYKKGQMAIGFMLPPFLTKDEEGYSALNILFSGFMYRFHLNSKELPDGKKTFFLKQDGTMKILGKVICNCPELLDRFKKLNDSFKTSQK